jgi:hypothetical protein
VSANDRLLRFLGSRYDAARSQADELRMRALELVIAGCVIDVRDHPVSAAVADVLAPPAVVEPLADEEPASDVPAWPLPNDEPDELPAPEPDPWSEEPEPEPLPEPEPTPQHELQDLMPPTNAPPEAATEPEPAFEERPPVPQPPPLSTETAPGEPLRGSWEPPTR